MNKNPKVSVEITENGFDIKLENWDGVTNVMIERMHYQIVRQSQVWKAKKLGALHAAKMRAEVAAQKEAESKSKVNEELANVIASKTV